MAANRAGKVVADTGETEYKDDKEDTENPLAAGHDRHIAENNEASDNTKNFEDITIEDMNV